MATTEYVPSTGEKSIQLEVRSWADMLAGQASEPPGLYTRYPSTLRSEFGSQSSSATWTSDPLFVSEFRPPTSPAGAARCERAKVSVSVRVGPGMPAAFTARAPIV